MELTFLDAALLWGALAAAVPVLVHLLMRRPPSKMVFPTAMFLAAGVRAASSARRLKRVFLMLLRAALPALLALILAGPLLAPARAGTSAAPAVVLLLDNSPSMTFRTAEGTLLDRAREAAFEVISAAPPGSLFAVASLRGVRDFVRDPEAARRLAEVELAAPAAGSLHEPLKGVVELVRTLPKGSRVSLFVLSDFAASAFGGEEPPALPPSVSVYLLDLGGGVLSDRAVLSVKPLSPAAGEGVPLSVEAALSATAKVPPQAVELVVEGKPVLSRDVTLEPGKAVPLVLEFLPPGSSPFVAGEVRFVSPDAFPANDSARFVVPRRPPSMVAVLYDASDPALREEARLAADAIAPPVLGDAAPYRVLLRPVDAFGPADADAACAVLLFSRTFPPGGFLFRRLRRGGALFVFALPNLDLAAFPAWTGFSRLRARFEPLDEPVALSSVTPDSSLVRFFRSTANGRLDRVITLGRFSLPRRPPGFSVALEWEDGVPALMMKPVGAGTVVLVNIPLDRSYSNFAGRAVFVPVLHETLKTAAAASRFRTSFFLGEGDIRFPLPAGTKSAELISPDGSATPLKFDPEAGFLSVAGNLEPGFYYVRFDGEDPPAVAFCVNYPPEESDLSRLSVSDLAERLGKGTVVRDPSHPWPASKGALDLVPFLVPLLFALFVFEFFVANTFYRAAPQPSEGAQTGETAGQDGGNDVAPTLER